MRPAVLRAYATMLPRLSAEEALHDQRVVAVGSGAMKERDRKKALAGWRRQAGLRRRARKARPADLAQVGIRVVKEPADG